MTKFVFFLIVLTLAACSANFFSDLLSPMEEFAEDAQPSFVSMFSDMPDTKDIKESSKSVEHTVKIVNGVKQEDSTHTKDYENDHGVKKLTETQS